MKFKALFGAEDRTSDFGVSAIFHETKQKMAEWHCGELLNAEWFQNLNEEAKRAITVYLGRKQLIEKVIEEGLEVCQALKEMLEDEKAEGRKEGMKEGMKKGLKKGLKEGETKRKEERISIIKNMIHEGMDYEMIHRIIKCSPKEFSLAAKN